MASRIDFQRMMRALRIDPFDETLRLVAADLIEDLSSSASDIQAAQELRRGIIALTAPDCKAIEALYRCRFLPGSHAKRFVADLWFNIPLLANTLTPKQYRYLWDLAYRYRKQIGRQTNAGVHAVHDEALAVYLGRQGRSLLPVHQALLPFEKGDLA